MISHLESVECGDHEFDYRLVHLLAEHKRVMLRRLEFVQDGHGSPADLRDVIGSYRNLSARMETYRLQAPDTRLTGAG